MIGSNNGTAAAGEVWPPNDEVTNYRGAESDHQGGVFVVMVDGHVTWVKDTVTPSVYVAIFTRQGGDGPSGSSEF